MKKKLALALAMTMSLGMVVPTMAATALPTQEEAWACFELSNSVQEETGGYDVYIETPESFRLGDWNPELPEDQLYDFGFGDYEFTEYDYYYAIRPDTTFTLKNTAPKGKNVYVTASMQCYVDQVYGEEEVEEVDYGYLPVNGATADFSDTPIVKLEEGTYVYVEGAGFQLAETGFEPSYRGEWVEIQPGKSVDFSFVEDLDTMGFGSDLYQYDGNNMYELTVSVNYPDQDYRWWFQFIFHNDEESIDNFVVPAAELTEDMLTLSNEHLIGTGVSYDCTVTNTTNEPLTGSYAVVFYTPELDENGVAHAQVNILDLDLAPGESQTSELLASHFDLVEDFEIMTGRFEDDADKEAFLQNGTLRKDLGRYNVDTNKCAAWLESLGVTF